MFTECNSYWSHIGRQYYNVIDEYDNTLCLDLVNLFLIAVSLFQCLTDLLMKQNNE